MEEHLCIYGRNTTSRQRKHMEKLGYTKTGSREYGFSESGLQYGFTFPYEPRFSSTTGYYETGGGWGYCAEITTLAAELKSRGTIYCANGNTVNRSTSVGKFVLTKVDDSYVYFDVYTKSSVLVDTKYERTGASIGTAMSTNPMEFPQDGRNESDNRWYVSLGLQ